MNITTREFYDRAAAAADMHDQFVTPQQFLYWLSQEVLALTLFSARHGWTQNVKTMTMTVTGLEAGAFPLTGISPLALVAVHQVRNDAVRRIHLANVVDFLHQVPGSARHTGDPNSYRLLRDDDNDRYQLGFYPEPSAGSVFLISYIPEPKRATFDATPAVGYTNSYNLPMGWEERPVIGCARRALLKEDPETRALMADILEADRLVEEACYDKVLAEHPTIRNLDREMRGWGRHVIFPPTTEWAFL